MAFSNVPNWQNQGTEPTSDVEQNGFAPQNKLPAAWMNWFINKCFALISEVQTAITGLFGSDLPKVDGTASAGSSGTFSRSDHVHPTDTTRAPVNSPVLTNPKGTTPAAGDNSTSLATTAYVQGEIGSGSTFKGAVRSVVLTGLSVVTNAAITATDTVLSAFGKLQKQIDALQTDKADKTEIPTQLPNPSALTISQGYGGTTGTYNGSTAKSISIPHITLHTSAPGTIADGELWGVY